MDLSGVDTLDLAHDAQDEARRWPVKGMSVTRSYFSLERPCSLSKTERAFVIQSNMHPPSASITNSSFSRPSPSLSIPPPSQAPRFSYSYNLYRLVLVFTPVLTFHPHPSLSNSQRSFSTESGLLLQGGEGEKKRGW